MSLLRLANGDDYPEASLKHLSDAEALLTKQRPDGAAYLSGYVVECALKSLHFIETGQEYIGHDFSKLLSQVVNAVAMVAGAKTAKYLGRATSSVLSSVLQYWKPENYSDVREALEKAGRNLEAIEEYLKVAYMFDTQAKEGEESEASEFRTRAYFRIARIYEEENNIPEAKKIYQKIIDSGAKEAKIAKTRLDELGR